MVDREHTELEHLRDRVLGMNEADRQIRDVWKEYGEEMSDRSLIDFKNAVEGEVRKRKGWAVDTELQEQS